MKHPRYINPPNESNFEYEDEPHEDQEKKKKRKKKREQDLTQKLPQDMYKRITLQIKLLVIRNTEFKLQES